MKKLPVLLISFAIGLLLPGYSRAQDAPGDAAELAIQKAPANESENQDPAASIEEPRFEEPLSELGDTQRRSKSEIVSFGKSVHLKSNETAEVIVVIGGSAKVDGNVSDTIVTIGGNVELAGEAQTAVAVLGNVTIQPGGQAKECVAVIGNVHVANDAQTREAIAVGGQVTVDEGGIVRDKTSLGLPGFAAPEWLQQWFQQCLLKLRPLAPSVGWIWVLAALIFLFYLFIALVFRSPVQVCVDEIIRRPATTFLVGLLSKILIPLLLLLLVGTGIGLIVVPFVIVGAIALAILGRVALMEAIGVALGRSFGSTTIQKPILALLIGAVLTALLYMIPVLGFLVLLLVGIWSLGAGVMAVVAKMRRERPPASPATPAGPNWPNAPVTNFAASNQNPAGQGMAHGQTLASMDPGSTDATGASVPPGEGIPPVVASVPIRYAGFWERMGAALLDIVLVSVVAAFAGGKIWWYLVALAYFSGMWAWRGTTLGGTVLGLKVARMDGQPVSFAVALIRALTAAFSAVVLFLGFFWIGWDKDKQGWHDKVAGTVVVKVPRAAPLICA